MAKKNRSMNSDAFALLGAEAVPGTEPVQAKPHRRERRAKSRGPAAWLLSALLVALLALPALFPGTFLKQVFSGFGESDQVPVSAATSHRIAGPLSNSLRDR